VVDEKVNGMSMLDPLVRLYYIVSFVMMTILRALRCVAFVLAEV